MMVLPQVLLSGLIFPARRGGGAATGTRWFDFCRIEGAKFRRAADVRDRGPA
jgi:hypothetical protein